MSKRCNTINKERIGIKMFTAWVQDSNNNTVKQLDDCMNISYITLEAMTEKYIDVLEAIGIDSDYFCIVDSQGSHFYPQYLCSVNIG